MSRMQPLQTGDMVYRLIRMISGTHYLACDIFKSAGTTRWGNVGAARRDSSTAEVAPAMWYST